MANINSSGNFIGRPSKDGVKEATQKFFWDRDHAEKPVRHVFKFIIWTIAFIIIDIFIINPVIAILFLIPVLLFKFDNADLLIKIIYFAFIINAALQHFDTYNYIKNSSRLRMYSLGVAISATIGVIVTVVSPFILEKVYDFSKIGSTATYKTLLLVVGVVMIVYSWVEYANNRHLTF